MPINDPNAEERGNLQLAQPQQQPKPQDQPQPAQQPSPRPPQPDQPKGEAVEPLTTKDWPIAAQSESQPRY